MRPGRGKRRARFILTGLYLLLAVYVWFDFTQINRDGLANLGLIVVTLPVALVGFGLGALVGADKFVLLPEGFGYLGDHALYFVPAAAGTAALIWLIGRAIDRRPG